VRVVASVSVDTFCCILPRVSHFCPKILHKCFALQASAPILQSNSFQSLLFSDGALSESEIWKRVGILFSILRLHRVLDVPRYVGEVHQQSGV